MKIKDGFFGFLGACFLLVLSCIFHKDKTKRHEPILEKLRKIQEQQQKGERK